MKYLNSEVIRYFLFEKKPISQLSILKSHFSILFSFLINQIHVNSMHYYIPRISVVRLNHLMDNQSNYYHPTSNSSGISNQSNQLELIGSYIIPGTQFYTVTAYQNPDVIRIKINNNPFAKGFRNRQDTDEFNDLAVLSVMNSRNKYMTTTSSSSSTSLSVSSINFSKKTHINYSNENYQC
ncbi:unnamed protein product [Schistosoma margrebowiei]|uniref:Uncharacterized protein n=1 Tax=Schistosoma margrebowiei TaxID=48269 RepID=A0A183LA37_9TREM|nr:unnamed protein product [Schistosoma margrebowiei]